MHLSSSTLKYYCVQFAIWIVIIQIHTRSSSGAGDGDGNSSIISSLPGFPADSLPFTLETGYIGVRENEEVQLFYYFIPSERSPDRDPLLLWLIGGPGCSAFSALVYENGPLAFDFAAFDGSLPSFILNPYSWTKVANIIFVDNLAGGGFSYATTLQGYMSSDSQFPKDIDTFFRKWLSNHPSHQNNRVYIGGDSYGGKMTALVALEIANGNEAGLEPQIKLQGYIIGNPVIVDGSAENEQVPSAHRMALISDKYFQMAQRSCDGEYANPDPNNVECNIAVQLCNECIRLVNTAHILEPKCRRITLIGQEDDLLLDLVSMSEQKGLYCREQNYVLSYVWANDRSVQEALHVRSGTVKEWKRCNNTVSYESDVPSVFEYHQLLIEKGFQVLVYSGDHDLVVPYLDTLKWVRKLNLSMEDDWRAWTVDGQVAGYTETYKKKNAYLTFATVKGGGHCAIEYKPKECLAMFSRWLTSYII